jgi:hypothetical protein
MPFGLVSEMDCSHAADAGLAIAETIKIADLFTSMRCRLLTLIKNWGAGGQGNGGMDREQDNGGGDDEQLDHDENCEVINRVQQQDGEEPERDEKLKWIWTRRRSRKTITMCPPHRHQHFGVSRIDQHELLTVVLPF